MYKVTSVALISMAMRAQNSGTSQQDTLMLSHIVVIA
jgi:hypothetical protein